MERLRSLTVHSTLESSDAIQRTESQGVNVQRLRHAREIHLTSDRIAEDVAGTPVVPAADAVAAAS
jgi:hypothetical protein